MTEQSFNQYAAPGAEVADVAPEGGYAKLDYFSARGRIGRLRYLAYLFGGGLLINIASGIVSAIFTAISPGLGIAISVVMWIPVLWFSIITGIKRAHDFNASGWWSIVSVIPLVGLIWVFFPGTQGGNQFGPPPPPNTTGVRVLGAILPVICTVAAIGILAAVAIPQYAKYTQRAHAAPAADPH